MQSLLYHNVAVTSIARRRRAVRSRARMSRVPTSGDYGGDGPFVLSGCHHVGYFTGLLDAVVLAPVLRIHLRHGSQVQSRKGCVVRR